MSTSALELNTAILPGSHIRVAQLLLDGAKPNEDTLTCALVSGLPHTAVAKLIETGADRTWARQHVAYSSTHNNQRIRINGGPVTHYASSSDALHYTKTHPSKVPHNQVKKYRQTITLATTPVKSASKPAGMAWRVRLMPMAPK